MKPRSTILLLGALTAFWMGAVPRSPAQAPTQEEPRAAEQGRAVGPGTSDRKLAVEIAAAPAGEFVEIPGGTFQMGCSPSDSKCLDNERPMHTVSIKRFRMGKYEVTVGQFREFVRATGYRTDAERAGGCWTVQADGRRWVDQHGKDWRNAGFPQTDRHPVVCVSWNDAKAYVQWLSLQGGGRYRLPSESEWEYAARAGGSGRYSFGESEAVLCTYGNAADRTAKQQFGGWTVVSCDDGMLYTAPVGSYRPNAFGLHDMHGNVWEWTADCYHNRYDGARSDETAWTGEGCSLRVARGGSWYSQPESVRSSNRGWNTTDNRGNYLGFRLVHEK